MEKELPESYQVTNDYPGDKAICAKEFSIQIHNVYTDKNNKDDIIPFIAVNYPYDEINTKYVTGEF